MAHATSRTHTAETHSLDFAWPLPASLHSSAFHSPAEGVTSDTRPASFLAYLLLKAVLVVLFGTLIVPNEDAQRR